VGTDRGHSDGGWHDSVGAGRQTGGGEPGWAGWTTVAAPVGLVTWCDTRVLKELAGWAGWAGWVGTVTVGRLQLQGLNILFQYFSYSKFEKYKNCTSHSPNFSKLYQVVDNFNRDNFPFGKKIRFPIASELKIQETKPI
jgi:hypothetical protein